jgi:hypothetical protein
MRGDARQQSREGLLPGDGEAKLDADELDCRRKNYGCAGPKKYGMTA